MKVYELIIGGMMAAALLSLPCSGLARSGDPAAQKKGGGTPRGGGGAPRGGGAGQRPRSAPPSRPAPQAPQVHARREIVRTPNYVSRPTSNYTPKAGDARPTREPGKISSDRTVYKPRTVSQPQRVTQRKFTKTTAGRVYDNGLRLRKGVKVTATWQRRYFPKGTYHYPYYRESFVRGRCFVSPFGFYIGICAPFIDASYCHVFPPAVTFVDEPVYNGNDCTGFNDTSDENLLNDANLDQDEPGLSGALDELSETFQSGNVDGLVSLIDPNTSIAIYFRGKYKYSMPSNDYVDVTRDAISAMTNVTFSIEYLHQRGPGVFSAAGHQTYRDANGQDQTMWLSFVLQDISGQWTLTQVSTAPGHYQRVAPQ